MKSVVIFGAIIALLGLLGFALPVFTTHEIKDVAKLGDIKIQTKKTSQVVPRVVSGGAIVLCLGLIAAGLTMKGRT